MTETEVNPIQSDEERRKVWLQDRMSGIGGSEVAAILLGPQDRPSWCSPMKLWLEKKGLAEQEENQAMRAGKRLERIVLEMYAEARGVSIRFEDSWTFHRDPQLSILGASLDARWAEGDFRPVDAKNIRFQDSKKFGKSGSETIPLYYACQLQTQMMATITPAADLACLFSGQDVDWFTVFNDDETAAIIRERVSAWWQRHIVEGIQPDIDGSDACTDYLAKRFKQASEAMLAPTDDIRETAKALDYLKKQIKEMEEEESALENNLKAEIGENQGILGICTWRKAKDGSKTDFEAAFARVVQMVSEGKAIAVQDLQALERSLTKTTPGSRRFLLRMKES